MIAITDKAVREIQRKAAEQGRTPHMRAGIRGGGCTGFSYVFDWANEQRDTDHVFEKDGIKLFVDPKSFPYLDGSELDFEKSLMGYGFKWNNPNVKSSCGCGESVSF